MVSSELTNLRNRITDLRKRLLPQKWPLVPSDSQSERARAFALLAHAEVETYLEQSILGYVDRRTSEWATSGTVSMCILGLVKTAQRQAELSPDLDKRSIDDVVKLGKQQLSTYAMTRNHGIREKNLKRLFLPAGIELSSLPAGFVPTLDAWGNKRGDYAHHGGYVSAANPKSEYDDARSVISLLALVDRVLAS